MAGSDLIAFVRRHWEANARFDAFGTILKRAGADGEGSWDQEAFFATGRADVARDLARLQQAGFALPRGKALDFGCGVGRLTRPLADTLGEAVGVDVSERMIELARTFHAAAPNLRFVHNPAPDLAAFETGSFDLVYSLITLQHMPPELARGYLAEFVRVCRPGGAILVQLVTWKRVSGRWYWPPTLLRWIRRRLNHRFAFAPVLAMYALPEREVRLTLESAGGKVVATWPDDAAGQGFESRVFAVQGMEPVQG